MQIRVAGSDDTDGIVKTLAEAFFRILCGDGHLRTRHSRKAQHEAWFRLLIGARSLMSGSGQPRPMRLPRCGCRRVAPN